MSNPTLIVGFEDVMSYIKNQDQRIKELEKENKKLQEEWDILNRFCGVPVKNNGQAVVNWICSFFTIEDKFYELEKENKKLKEENKKQQERAERFRVLLCNRSEELVKALSPWKKEHQDHKRILEAIGELKQQNDNLEVEIKELKKVYDFGNSESDEESD